MQEYLILALVAPDGALQLRHCICDVGSHAGRTADVDTCPSAEVFREAFQHVWNVWSAVLCSPTISLRTGREEGEAHQVLLEVCWRLREAEVKVS